MGTQAKLKKLGREVVVRASSLNPEDMAGITEPLGFWDPAGFSKDGDIAAYRRAEIKHGRVCMQASLGIIVADLYHPFFDAWGDGEFVSASASHFTATAQANFWPAFWLMTASHELATTLADYDGKDELFGVGPFWDPLGLKPRIQRRSGRWRTRSSTMAAWQCSPLRAPSYKSCLRARAFSLSRAGAPNAPSIL